MCVLTINPNFAKLKCDKCGSVFSISLNHGIDLNKPSDPLTAMLLSCLHSQKCDNCVVAERAEEQKKNRDEQQRYRTSHINEFLDEANIPKKMRFNKDNMPPNPALARWICTHCDENLLLTGESGCGKTTSGCASLGWLIEKRWKRAKYYSFYSLVSMWRSANARAYRRSEVASDVDDWLNSLNEEYDVIFIDEITKGAMNGPAEDVLFTLVDLVSSGKVDFKLWLAGNLRNGFKEKLVDPDPLVRRLKENFNCIICDDGKIDYFDPSC